MKKRGYLLLVSLLFVLVSIGQNTVLWKVTNTKNAITSYIFGTYHLLGNEFVDSYPVIKEKLKGADLIITETKLDRAKARAYYNARPSSDTLAGILQKEDIDFIRRLFIKSGIDIEKFTPGELYVKLQAFYPKYKCGATKNNDTISMDEYIQYLGNLQQKKMYYLETDSFQLEKITIATKPYDWPFFKHNIFTILKKYRSEDTDKNLCLFANQYTSFNLDYQFKTAWSSNLKDVMGNNELIKKRNDDWVKQLAPILENNNCFIAVGLLHLYFDCGLPEQLRKLGYTVEQVKMN